jgi:Protein of unknown function (DUF3226)
LSNNPNQLIVEGYRDLSSVASLMGEHIDWSEDKNRAPVWIEISNGADEILKEGYLSVSLKSPTIKTLGIVIDADEEPKGRYQRIRQLCEPFFPTLPPDMPKGGLIVENEEKRFGLWIMPDNESEGILETFLRYLVPDSAAALWKHATESVKRAYELGCKCRDVHLPKAELYTWLSWDDPPGQSPGLALTKNVLDPQSIHAKPFVDWFRQLFKL